MIHSTFLKQALTLAQSRRGFCSPNPSVGAVIIDTDHHVLATGFHQVAGKPHAEVEALKQVNFNAPGATLYVTLEPCCHHGKTPPCTDVIIQSGIKAVVYGYPDPNPKVRSLSEDKLRAAGISVTHFPIPEINEFYKSYAYWTKTGRPFITAKIALTLDGKIASESGQPIAITGNSMNHHTHQLRKMHDALLTSAKTIQADNPKLNVRLENETIKKPLFVLDSQLTLSPNANVFSTTESITLFHGPNALNGTLQAKGAKCIQVKKDSFGLSLNDVINHIGQLGIHDLWIEAGGKLFSAFAQQNLLNKALIYVAPMWLGKGLSAFGPDFIIKTTPANVLWQQFGNDSCCEIEWEI